MEFLCELRSTKQTKLVSLDNQYEIRLVSDDSNIMDLGKLPPDTLFKVTIEPQENVYKDFSESV